jgi:type II secretory pathway component PulF
MMTVTCSVGLWWGDNEQRSVYPVLSTFNALVVYLFLSAAALPNIAKLLNGVGRTWSQASLTPKSVIFL